LETFYAYEEIIKLSKLIIIIIIIIIKSYQKLFLHQKMQISYLRFKLILMKFFNKQF